MTTLGNSAKARTPQGMKVAPMSYAKLESVATNLKGLLPTIPFGKGARIDCVRVLEQLLPQAQYQCHVAEKSELQDCAAFTIPDQKLIVLRSDVYDGLFQDDVFSRSTVIHEFSHIVLAHAATLHRGAVLGKHDFYEDSEWQAKALTAAIMMPLEICKAANSADELAFLCGTSRQSATYRLDRLIKDGIIKPRPVRGLFDDIEFR